MARTVQRDRDAFLATLRDRYEHHRREPAYEAMMYHATDPPGPTTLSTIVRFTHDERPEHPDAVAVPDDTRALDGLARITRTMQWPDAEPLAAAAVLLPDWHTLHVSTYLHTMIPDYPIWGPSESTGLRRLGHDIPYEPDPTRAVPGYRAYIEAVKDLREAARFDEVPESHHYLTRIVQTALQELGETA